MITTKIFVNGNTFCWLLNIANGFWTHCDDNVCFQKTSLKKRRAYKFEVQVPIQSVVNVDYKKDLATLDLNVVIRTLKAGF